MSIWNWLFNPSGLTAHGFCLSWAPGLVALHAGSDAVVGLAYFSIPLALVALIRRRPDLKYGWVAYLFVAFILACGTTHLMSILTLWSPAYGVEGIIKLVTAVLSIATAAILWPLIPRLAALPSAAQLARVNAQLEATVGEQARTATLLREREGQIRASNIELEQRVAERTAELLVANSSLNEALAQRVAAQQALARSEEQYRVSFDAATVGKVHSDPHTNLILRANRAFAHMLGYEPDELVGRLGWELTAPEDQPSDRAEYARVVAGELDAYVREKQFLRKDGTSVWARVSANIISFPESGAPDITIAVVEDIDERHKARAALQVAKHDLEGVVEERTAALRQRDLLLREVYHRVKNNLQIVDSMLVMQAHQLSQPEAKSALLSLRSRVYSLGLVHHQLMGSSNFRTFDIAPFLSDLSSNLLAGSAADGVRLTVKAAALEVGLDLAIPLGLLVTELVTNAIKHAFPGGSGNIEVLFERGDDGEVVLIVSDDGCGGVSGAAPAESLGTSIIRGLVAQLGATLSTETHNGTRTEIRVAAPELT